MHREEVLSWDQRAAPVGREHIQRPRDSWQLDGKQKWTWHLASSWWSRAVLAGQGLAQQREDTWLGVLERRAFRIGQLSPSQGSFSQEGSKLHAVVLEPLGVWNGWRKWQATSVCLR